MDLTYDKLKLNGEVYALDKKTHNKVKLGQAVQSSSSAV